MRKLCILVLWVALATILPAAPAKTSSLQGTFLNVEVGDYVHINVKDDKGATRSFWITPDGSFTPFVEHPESYKNRRVKVTWRTVRRDIPEHGGPMTINEATSIKLLP